MSSGDPQTAGSWADSDFPPEFTEGPTDRIVAAIAQVHRDLKRSDDGVSGLYPHLSKLRSGVERSNVLLERIFWALVALIGVVAWKLVL